jgi:alpha-tubulin suppressor-like RCC1 family protein
MKNALRVMLLICCLCAATAAGKQPFIRFRKLGEWTQFVKSDAKLDALMAILGQPEAGPDETYAVWHFALDNGKPRGEDLCVRFGYLDGTRVIMGLGNVPVWEKMVRFSWADRVSLSPVKSTATPAPDNRPTTLAVASGALRGITAVSPTPDGRVRVVHSDGAATYQANELPEEFLVAWKIDLGALKAAQDALRHEQAKGTFATSKAVAVAVAGATSLALTADGNVWEWGESLGDPAYLLKPIPMDHVIAIACGGSRGSYRCLALKADGTVWQWGRSARPKAGDASLPVQISNLADVVAVSAGDHHGVALKKDGTVWAWGNKEGVGLIDEASLPPNVEYNSTTAAQVKGLDQVIALAAKGSFTLALKKDGSVWGWGYSPNDILGYKVTKRFAPEPIQGLSDIVEIAAGGQSCLALQKDGALLQWGLVLEETGKEQVMKVAPNASLHRKEIRSSNTAVPKRVPGLTEVVRIASGFGRCLALQRDGRVFQWGTTLGPNGGTVVLPKEIASLRRIVAIEAGSNELLEHFLAVRDDGTVWAWGNNHDGELGIGQKGGPVDVAVPVMAKGFSSVRAK